MTFLFFILILIFAISPIFLIVVLIKPTLFTRFFGKWATRKILSLAISGIFVGSFTLLAILVEQIDTYKPVQNEVAKIQDSDNKEERKSDVEESVAYEETTETKTTERNESSEESDPKVEWWDIEKVVDGDTVHIKKNGIKEKVRLIGLDTPEAVDPRKPVECFGKEASKHAKEILNGQKIMIELDDSQGERDKYGRLLAYIFLENGTNFNKKMIADGYGYEYTYNKPYKYQDEFKQAQTMARDNNLGLWSNKTCSGEKGKIAEQETGRKSTVATYPIVKDNEAVGKTNLKCAGKTRCSEMNDCEEAYFYFEQCGVNRLDGDNDGVPCEVICN